MLRTRTERVPIQLLAISLIAGGCGGGLRPLPPATAPAPFPTDGTTAAPLESTSDGRALPDDEAALVARDLMVPVDGVSPEGVSDSYAANRGDRLHSALDIMAPRGSPVLAADGGTVWKVRSSALGGLTIYTIDDDQRFIYYYAHLDRYAEGLREGQRIGKGDLLGYVGTTGNAPPNVPHLHFQLMRYKGDGKWWDGDPSNPRQFLLRPGKVNRE
ncbi:MAG: M23 family metallopeptidase [Gemmatimonadaceae bacterium]